MEKWLPGVVRGNGNDGRAITLRQLLNHTSGLFNYTSDPEFADHTSGPGFPGHRYTTYRPADLVALAMKRPPRDASGTASYSNTNYVLAGMIIEKMTGHSYAHEVQRRILTPLKLRETSFPGVRPWMPLPHPPPTHGCTSGSPTRPSWTPPHRTCRGSAPRARSSPPPAI